MTPRKVDWWLAGGRASSPPPGAPAGAERAVSIKIKFELQFEFEFYLFYSFLSILNNILILSPTDRPPPYVTTKEEQSVTPYIKLKRVTISPFLPSLQKNILTVSLFNTQPLLSFFSFFFVFSLKE